MLLSNEMLLYHASYTKIYDIDINKAIKGKDFGTGFYLTRNEIDAKIFIKRSISKAVDRGEIETQDFGYINIYKFNEKNEELNIYEFLEPTDKWLWFIVKNRKENLAEKMDKLIDENISNSDIIIGKIANDKTNKTITGFLGGIFGDITSKDTIEYVLKLLKTNVLDYQYCFKTEKAIKCLEFVEAKKYEL